MEAYAASQGVRAISVATDVSKPEDCHRLVEAAVEAFGRIDVLVNNAGIDDKNKSITNCDLELWNKVISTDQDSVYYMMKETLPYMEKAGKGSIVNISSIGATRSNAGISYTAAKMAVIGMTKNVAIQVAGTGIRCNAICPGNTQTNIGVGMRQPSERGMAKATTGYAGATRSGTPEEISAAAVFLASDQAGFINGETLTIDGGWSAY